MFVSHYSIVRSFLSCLHVLYLHSFFFFTHPATTDIYTLSLHDALPICPPRPEMLIDAILKLRKKILYEPLGANRSEEHTSELQSLRHLVCRLLLEKKKKQIK